MSAWGVVSWCAGGVLILVGLYGLHRLCLWLEAHGQLYYWHKQPSGGGGSNPFHEMIEPQVKHVKQVREQRPAQDHDGGPSG
jgi:hypothetical protein